MPTPLEATSVDADRKIGAALGDTFTYTDASGVSVTGANGYVEYGEDIANPVPTAAGSIAQVIEVELSMLLFPARPNAACRVSNLSKYPGEIWQPIAVRTSVAGDWLFNLKKVSA